MRPFGRHVLGSSGTKGREDPSTSYECNIMYFTKYFNTNSYDEVWLQWKSFLRCSCSKIERQSNNCCNLIMVLYLENIMKNTVKYTIQCSQYSMFNYMFNVQFYIEPKRQSKNWCNLIIVWYLYKYCHIYVWVSSPLNMPKFCLKQSSS